MRCNFVRSDSVRSLCVIISPNVCNTKCLTFLPPRKPVNVKVQEMSAEGEETALGNDAETV